MNMFYQNHCISMSAESSEILFKTELSDAMDPHISEDETNNFGILDLQTVYITEAPHFTEEKTLQAMEILHLIPEDLVFDQLLDYDGDPSLRLQVSIDLEEKRIRNIKKIISAREQLLNGNSHIPRLPNRKVKTKRKKSTEIILSNRRSKSTGRSTKTVMPTRNTDEIDSILSKSKRSRSVKKEEEMRKEHDKIVRQRALLRLKKQEEAVAIYEAQKEKSRMQNQLELEKQEHAVTKLKEKKRKQYEQEQKWRQENIYKISPQQNKPSHSSIANMRRKLILTQTTDTKQRKSTSSLQYPKNTRIPRLLKK